LLAVTSTVIPTFNAEEEEEASSRSPFTTIVEPSTVYSVPFKITLPNAVTTPLAMTLVAVLEADVVVLDVLDVGVVLLAVEATEDASEDPSPHAAKSVESTKATPRVVHCIRFMCVVSLFLPYRNEEEPGVVGLIRATMPLSWSAETPPRVAVAAASPVP
jgi:hypothetical protein